ncbi:hypothetical protein JTB14_006677 [Gonioctena quinquepunctata]|nr:hypothetical protein JTB14_006677 [Gonioctena quinquepunctata]
MSKFFVLLLLFSLKNISVATFIRESVIDVRRSCLDNISNDLYLPSEAGEINSFVIFVSSKFIKPVCNFNIYALTSDIRLIFVIEFIGKSFCGKNDIILHNNGDGTTTDVCTNDINQGIFRYPVLVKELSVFINIREKMEQSLMKMVITAATTFTNNFGNCSKLGKISCVFDEMTVCIDKSLLCDGDFNCGLKFDLDEDRIIFVHDKMWLVMLFTLCFVTYNSYLIYRCLKKHMTPIPEDFFIVDEKKEESTLKSYRKPPQVKISPSHSRDHLRISLSDEPPSEDPTEVVDYKKNNLSSREEEYIPSSSITEDWDLSAESLDNNRKFRKVRKKKWPVFSKAEVPSYEKRFSDKMKKKMLSSTTTDDDEKPKITFYATTAKLP